MASRRENKTALAKVRKGRGASANRFGMGIQDREEDTPTKVFGAITGGILPNSTVLKRAAQDPTGTALGAVEVASLASPIANAYRAYNLLSGGDFSVTGAGMEDVEQAVEAAGIIPTGKAVTMPAKFGVGLLDMGIKGAARRTTPAVLSAASGGIISGGPKSLARTATSGATTMPIREALPLPPVERFMPRQGAQKQFVSGGFAEQGPDLSGMTDNQKAKVLREFLNPDTKKVNVNTGEVGNVVGQDELESQLVTLNIRGRLSSRSRKYGKPYDFNADSRAGAIISSREKGTGVLSEEDKIRIRQEEVNRNITETRRLLEDAKTNYPDEYDAAMEAGGIPAVLDNFEAAHIQTLTSGGRMDWPNIRFIPKEIHKAQGTKPWAGMGQTLVR